MSGLEDVVRDGVSEGVDGWLISVDSILLEDIPKAVYNAVRDWMEAHTEELLERMPHD